MIAAFQGGLNETGKPYLHGFGAWVWVLVALQSGGSMMAVTVPQKILHSEFSR